jgi:hypothetical protein
MIVDRVVDGITIQLHVLAGQKISLPRLDAERTTPACDNRHANDQE